QRDEHELAIVADVLAGQAVLVRRVLVRLTGLTGAGVEAGKRGVPERAAAAEGVAFGAIEPSAGANSAADAGHLRDGSTLLALQRLVVRRLDRRQLLLELGIPQRRQGNDVDLLEAIGLGGVGFV